MIDLVHFKRINDRFGHHAGDEVLCAVVEKMQDSIRGIDILAGEEERNLLFFFQAPPPTPLSWSRNRFEEISRNSLAGYWHYEWKDRPKLTGNSEYRQSSEGREKQ